MERSYTGSVNSALNLYTEREDRPYRDKTKYTLFEELRDISIQVAGSAGEGNQDTGVNNDEDQTAGSASGGTQGSTTNNPGDQRADNVSRESHPAGSSGGGTNCGIQSAN